jgi:hypothetical protein
VLRRCRYRLAICAGVAAVAAAGTFAPDDAFSSAALLVRCGELQAPVASRVSAIREAALNRDYEALEAQLDPETFRYSFGGDGDPIGYWRELESFGEDALGAIAAVLVMPCAVTDYGTGLLTFAWPAAAEIPYAELSQDERAGLAALYEGMDIDYYYMDGPVDGFYAGWRLYIDETGRWTAFIAGD